MLSCVRPFGDPMDCSPPGSSVREVLQARILEWVAIPFPGEPSAPGMEPGSPEFHALADGFFTTKPPGEAPLSKVPGLGIDGVDSGLCSGLG